MLKSKNYSIILVEECACTQVHIMEKGIHKRRKSDKLLNDMLKVKKALNIWLAPTHREAPRRAPPQCLPPQSSIYILYITTYVLCNVLTSGRLLRRTERKKLKTIM